jgi:N-acetylglutamate synthase-like GNAT family acetyltransferase
MSESDYRVRRATVDDRPALLSLGAAMHLPADELERRLKEFQLVESLDGTLLGALGMEVIGRYGRLHNETFADFGASQLLRELLWQRMQSVAASLGLSRIWTNETAPFWKQNGFQIASDETLKKLPAAWAGLRGSWVTLELRSEAALKKVLETDFNQLMAGERIRREEALRKARIAKYAGVTLAILVACAGVVLCVYLLRNHNLLHR